jgi:hypothetical protein
VIDRDVEGRGLGSLLVPWVGSLVEAGERWEPWQLLDPGGEAVGAVAVWFRDLQRDTPEIGSGRDETAPPMHRGLRQASRWDLVSQVSAESGTPPRTLTFRSRSCTVALPSLHNQRGGVGVYVMSDLTETSTQR